MAAALRIEDTRPGTPEEDEAFDILEAFHRLKERERAGDVGHVTYENAVGAAVARSRGVQVRPDQVHFIKSSK